MTDVENINVLRQQGGQGVSRDSPEGLTRRVDTPRARTGQSGLNRGRAHLFKYDRLQGAANAQRKGDTDQADRMPTDKAAELLHKIHDAYAVDKASEGFLYDFDHALFVCYAMNGGSQIGPHGRVKFRVVRYGDAGIETDHFEYATTFDMCGIEFRRFFRTYANEVVEACRNVYEDVSGTDGHQMDLRDRMIKLASARGIARFPYLLADCADAATNINEVEFSAVLTSKTNVIASTANAVDGMNNAKPIRSLDNYDSTLGRNVSAANDIHAAGPTYY